ncbi:MAG: lysophospholipid acyltransferase family protein, partial [Anaerolineales bacterium]|nr:lysophospholipid acyltransferase family protein [Anaerolineales bacterium]
MIALYWIWRIGMFCVGFAPPRLSFAAAEWMGTGAYYLMPLRRRVARENFAYVLRKPTNDPAVGRVTHRAFQNFARLLRDVMLYPKMSIRDLEKRITLLHGEYFEQALARGKGAIIVSAHFGNMDLPSALLAHRYAPLTLVGETLRPQALMDLLTRIRRDKKVFLYPYASAPRKIIEALKHNEMTAFLLDFGVTHHFDITTVPVNFFNTETDFPAGPAQLALLTGAPIVVGHAHVQSDGHIIVDVAPPLIVQRSGSRHHDLQATMQEIARRMEDFIRAHPEQWYIFRPMWKDSASARRKIPSLSKTP